MSRMCGREWGEAECCRPDLSWCCCDLRGFRLSPSLGPGQDRGLVPGRILLQPSCPLLCPRPANWGLSGARANPGKQKHSVYLGSRWPLPQLTKALAGPSGLCPAWEAQRGPWLWSLAFHLQAASTWQSLAWTQMDWTPPLCVPSSFSGPETQSIMSPVRGHRCTVGSRVSFLPGPAELLRLTVCS